MISTIINRVLDYVHPPEIASKVLLEEWQVVLLHDLHSTGRPEPEAAAAMGVSLARLKYEYKKLDRLEEEK